MGIDTVCASNFCDLRYTLNKLQSIYLSIYLSTAYFFIHYDTVLHPILILTLF